MVMIRLQQVLLRYPAIKQHSTTKVIVLANERAHHTTDQLASELMIHTTLRDKECI